MIARASFWEILGDTCGGETCGKGRKVDRFADFTDEVYVFGAQEYLLFFSHEGGKNVTRKTYVIAAHDELISCIDVHGTGKDSWMVTGSSDNTVKVWNVASRLRRAIFREASKVLSVAINEKWIVSGSDDGDISIYCAKKYVRLRLLESAHGMDRVWKVALFETDLFLSAGEDKILRVTNAASGASVGNTVRVPFKIWDAVVADDGCRFAAAGLRGRAVVVPWAREGTVISPVARKVPARGRKRARTPVKLALLARPEVDALDRPNRRRSGPVRYDPSPQEDESEGEEDAMVPRQRPRSKPGLSSTDRTRAAVAMDDHFSSDSECISPTRFSSRIAQSERMRPRPETGVSDRPNRRKSGPVRYCPSSSESPPPLPVRRAIPVECPASPGFVNDLFSLRRKARNLSPVVISQMSCDELAVAIAAFIVSYDASNGERFDELWPSLLKALQNNDFAGWCLAVRDGDNETPSVSAQELGHSIVRQLLRDKQATAGVRIGLQRFIAEYMKHLPH